MAQGAELASGFISLHVKYASAMGQIADDFGAIEKKSKASGESITKNLVDVTKKLTENAAEAKRKVTEVGDAYTQQRDKVLALRAALKDVDALREKSRQVNRAYTDEFEASRRRANLAVAEEVQLQKQLAAERSKAASAQDGDKIVSLSNAITAAKEKEAHAEDDLNRLEKESISARKELSSAIASNAKIQGELTTATGSAKDLLEQYNKALDDAKRKQDLASQSAQALKSSVGNVSGFSAWGHKLAHALGAPFTKVLGKTGNEAGGAFRRAFGREMDRTQHQAGQQVRRLASGIWMGMTPGMMGAAGVGLAVGKAFQAGFNREETINTVRLRLQSMGKTAVEVQQLMAQAENSVVGTQFSLADSMTAASTAMSAGIKLGPEMVSYLDNIANAAAVTGEEYGTVADAFNRIQNQGVVSLENLQPLINKDLPVLQWLTDYYKKDFPAATREDITEMISKKMIPADVFNTVMSQHLNNSMKGMTKKTVKGALADVMTQMGKVTQSILHPFMGDLPTFLNGLGDKLRRFAEYIKPGMEAAAAWIKKTWNDLWPKVKEVFGTTVSFLKRKWEEWWPTIKQTLEYIKSRWDNIFPSLKEKFQSFVKAFGRAWTAMGPYVKAAAAVIGWAILWAIDRMPLLIGWVNNILNWFATLLDWLREDFFPVVKRNWDAFYEWVRKAWEFGVKFKDKVVEAFNTLKSTLTRWFDWIEDKWNWLADLTIPDWVKWIIEKGGNLLGFDIDLMSSSTPLVQGAGASVPKPARLRDSGHVPSGPQSKYVAGLVLDMFDIQGDIGGSYLPRSEGGPSVPGTHDAGLSIDIPIGPSADQRAMGDRIEKFLQENAKQLGIVYTIWKDKGKNTGMGTRAAGTEFTAGGHQDHIDVMFDGKTFGQAVATSVGSNGKTYTVAPASMSTPLGGNDLPSMLTRYGIPAEMHPLIAAFAKAEGNNPSGVPTLGFVDSQAGSTLEGHVRALAAQLRNRQSVAGPFPGGSPEQQAAWMAKVVGQTGNPSDWQGNAQPPLADYIGSIVKNWGPRRVSVDAYGGVALTDSSKPMQPGDPGYVPPTGFVGPQPGGWSALPAKPSEPWFGGGGSFAAPSGEGGGGSWGDEPKGFWDKVKDWVNSHEGPTAKSVLGLDWTEKWDSLKGLLDKVAVGGMMLPLRDTNMLPTHLADAPPAENFYKDWYPRKEGPKGTADDPIVTTDPEVAENTDPANQPEPGGATEDSTVTAETPHAGTGAPPGPGGQGQQGFNNQAIVGAAEGLGGVATTAFSDQFAGTPFSNPLEWPTTKSIGALFSFFGSVLGGDGGGGAGGLAGLLFPGSANEQMDWRTRRQIRDSGQDVERKRKRRDALLAEKADMDAKAFKYSDEDRARITDELAQAEQELGDAVEDNAHLLQENQQSASGGGLLGWLNNALNPVAVNQPNASGLGPVGLGGGGGATGFTLPAFGEPVTGTPGAAPGDASQTMLIPGGSGSPIPALGNAIPSASNAQPSGQQGGNVTNIDASVHQQVPVEGQPAARDAAVRGQNASLRSPLITTQQIPGVRV